MMQVSTSIRLIFIYRPLRSLLLVAAAFFWLPATVLFGRFAWFYLSNASPAGHVQSLIAATVLALTGVQIAALGVLADLTAVNRRMIEDLRSRARMER